MEKKMFVVERCKDKGAFKAKPLNKLRMDFGRLKKRFEVVVDSPYLMVIKIEGEEVIVHDYGELVFKSLKEKEKIEKIAEEIYNNG